MCVLQQLPEQRKVHKLIQGGGLKKKVYDDGNKCKRLKKSQLNERKCATNMRSMYKLGKVDTKVNKTCLNLLKY